MKLLKFLLVLLAACAAPIDYRIEPSGPPTNLGPSLPPTKCHGVPVDRDASTFPCAGRRGAR